MATSKKIAVIGGSGIYKLENVQTKEKFEIQTPFGTPSDKIHLLSVENTDFYFLPRHGVGHKINPSEINYRANIWALKKMGVNCVLSISAVGSLREDLSPGMVFIPDQFIDWTKGLRKRTFFDDGVVGHVSVANPVDEELALRLSNACKKNKLQFKEGGSYICIEGPQFSSKAESNFYRNILNASVIGMTNVPESYLCKEAGIAYATAAMITDYDCWKAEHCTLDEIMKVMQGNYSSAQKILQSLIPDLVKNPIQFKLENKQAIVTDPTLLTNIKKEALETVLKEC